MTRHLPASELIEKGIIVVQRKIRDWMLISWVLFISLCIKPHTQNAEHWVLPWRHGSWQIRANVHILLAYTSHAFHKSEWTSDHACELVEYCWVEHLYALKSWGWFTHSPTLPKWPGHICATQCRVQISPQWLYMKLSLEEQLWGSFGSSRSQMAVNPSWADGLGLAALPLSLWGEDCSGRARAQSNGQWINNKIDGF